MATLTAWMFARPQAAGAMLETLEDLQDRKAISILDAAVVTWDVGRKKPQTRELHSSRKAGAWGGFWGLLFGLIFFIPLLGLAVGAATGVIVSSLRDVGINDSFIKGVREKVTPGTSALFLLSSDATMDLVVSEFEQTDAELISTNLSPEQEEKLREAFAEES